MEGPAVRSAWAWVLAGAACLYLLGQSGRDLWLIDEPRDAGIAWDMAAHGDWVVPRLNGEPFLEKPPLSFAAAALALKAWPGRPETAVRLPSALFCLGVLACTLWLGWRLLDLETGLIAAAVLATSREFLVKGHECVVDTGLCFWSALAVAAAVEALASGRRGWWGLSGLAFGAAFLSKGPIGVVLPAVGLGLYLLKSRGTSAFRAVSWPLLLVPALILAGAWLGLLHRAGFLDAYLAEQARRAGAGIEHAKPWYYYFLRVFEDFAPWSLLIPGAAVWAFRRQATGLRLPACWFLGALVILSIPATKRGIYLVPAFPALALLTADFLRMEMPGRWLRVGLTFLAGAGLAAPFVTGFGFPECLAAGGACGAILGVWRSRVPAASAGAGVVLACTWLVSVWAPAQEERHVLGPLIRSLPPAAVAGVHLSEPVRGAFTFVRGERMEMLAGDEAVEPWLAGPGPAVVVVQGRMERTPEELAARFEGKAAVLKSLKRRHEVLLVLANPEAMMLAAQPAGGGR